MGQRSSSGTSGVGSAAAAEEEEEEEEEEEGVMREAILNFWLSSLAVLKAVQLSTWFEQFSLGASALCCSAGTVLRGTG